MRASELRWRRGSFRAYANYGRPIMSPCRPASPRRLAARPTGPACSIPPTEDDDGVVAEGRLDVRRQALTRLEDAAISREVGMLLGNDLGQMRVQFNAKAAYVVEPIYRGDGLGLWDFW